MPILGNRKKDLRQAVKATSKEIKQEEQDSQSNLDIILDWLGRPSRTVAGLGKEVIDATQGKEFNPIDAVWGNLTGDRKDQWSKNINQATGLPEDSWTARIGGFAGDAILDPLNVVNPAAPVIKAVRPAIQGVQAAAKAGKYGKTLEKIPVLKYAKDAPQGLAEFAKGIRGTVSNYAGLIPEEQAVAQLYDAKLHSFDDIVKEKFINQVHNIDKKVASIASAGAKADTRGALIGEALTAAKQEYKDLVAKAQQEMVAKAGTNVSPDMAEHIAKRTKKAWNQTPVDQFLGKAQSFPIVGDFDRVWKKSATRWNPLFYSNNMMGNVQQTIQEATKSDKFFDPQAFAGYADTLGQYARQYGRKAGLNVGSGVDGYTPDMLEELGKARGVKTNVSSMYKGREVKGRRLEATLDAVADVYGDSKKNALSKLRDKVSVGLDKAQSLVEGDSRQAAFNTYFKQAIKKGLSKDEAADEAALRVTQSLFDYEDVTDPVKLVRSLPFLNAPFATWAVKNTPRQAAMLGKNPAYAAKWDAANRFGGTVDEDADTPIPGYMRERIAIPIGKFGGDKNAFFKPAATISDLNNIPFSLGSMGPNAQPLKEMLGPIPETMLELDANEHSFTGRQIAADGSTLDEQLMAPQNVQADMQWLLNTFPKAGDMVGGSRSRYTNKPQLPYIVNKAADTFPAQRTLLRAMHTLFDNENASEKLPLGQFIPFDVKTDKQLEISKQMEKRDVVKRANAKARNRRNKSKRLSETERYKRIIEDD